MEELPALQEQIDWLGNPTPRLVAQCAVFFEFCAEFCGLASRTL